MIDFFALSNKEDANSPVKKTKRNNKSNTSMADLLLTSHQKEHPITLSTSKSNESINRDEEEEDEDKDKEDDKHHRGEKGRRDLCRSYF